MAGYEKVTIENIREIYTILDISLFVNENGKRLDGNEVLANQKLSFLTDDKRKIIQRLGQKCMVFKKVYV